MPFYTLGGGIGDLGRQSGLPETYPRALLTEEEGQMSARKQHIPHFRNYGDTHEKAKLPWKVQIEIKTIGHARDHNITEEHQSEQTRGVPYALHLSVDGSIANSAERDCLPFSQ